MFSWRKRVEWKRRSHSYQRLLLRRRWVPQRRILIVYSLIVIVVFDPNNIIAEHFAGTYYVRTVYFGIVIMIIKSFLSSSYKKYVGLYCTVNGGQKFSAYESNIPYPVNPHCYFRCPVRCGTGVIKTPSQGNEQDVYTFDSTYSKIGISLLESSSSHNCWSIPISLIR